MENGLLLFCKSAEKTFKGEYLNDAIAIAGSLDIILPEVDK